MSKRRRFSGTTGEHSSGSLANQTGARLKRLNPLEKFRNLPGQNFASFCRLWCFCRCSIGAVWAVAGQNLANYAGFAREGLGPALHTLADSLKSSPVESGLLFALIGCLDFCAFTAGITSRCA